MANYAIRCLACDLVFSIVISRTILNRKMLRKGNNFAQATAVIFAIIGFCFTDLVKMEA